MAIDQTPDVNPFDAEDERLWDLYQDGKADAHFDCNRLQACDISFVAYRSEAWGADPEDFA